MGNRRELQIIIDAKDKASRKLEALSEKAKDLKPTFQKMAAVGAVAFGGLSYSIKKVIDIAGELEQQSVAFEVMLGSTKAATKMLKDLSDFASRTPFEIQGIRGTAKQLLAMGIESNKLIDTLKFLGDVSAGTSAPLSRIALNFGQVKTQGKLTGRELRDFAVNGVPLIESLAKEFDVSKTKIQDMVSAGKIGFKDVEKAFIGMTSEGGKFANLMDKQSKTTKGQISNLKDEITLMAESIGTTLLPMVKKALEFIQPLVEKIGQWVKVNPVLTRNIILSTTALAGLALSIGTIGLVLPSIIKGFGFLGTAIGKVGIAIKFMLSHPILILISALITGVIILSKKFGGLNNAFVAVAAGLNALINFIGVGIKSLGNSIVKFMNKVLDYGNDFYNWISKLLKKLGVDIGEADLKIDFEFDTEKNWKNINEMNGLLDEMKAEVEAKKQQQNEEMGNLYDQDLVNFSNNELEKLDSVTETSEEMKKATEEMGKTFDDVMAKNRSALAETEKKVIELQNKMSDLFVNKAKDDLNIRQSYAQAYVDQEKKVKDLKVKWQNETDQNTKDGLLKEYEYQKEILDSKKNIEIVYQNEVNEARRKASLTDFQRQLEDLENKTTLLNQEFEKKHNEIKKEIEEERKKYEAIKNIQTWALLEQDKFLASQEKQVVASVNRQISYYNKLAIAMKNAQAGNYTSYVSLASNRQSIANKNNARPNINITVNGDVSGEELTEKVSQGIMRNLSFNTSLNY